MKFALGKKVNMAQIFDKDGRVHAVTLIETSPLTVVQVKTKAKDGYEAVQFGFGERKEKNISKPLKGHIKELGNFSLLKEERLSSGEQAPEIGSKITPVEVFTEGDVIEVSGATKGKGFQGVVKRHRFKGGPRSHGQKHSEREPGSIGGGGRDGGRVAKGMRMAGRMGGNRITVKNLKVVMIDKDQGTLYVAGAIPGRRGSVLEIRG